MSHLPCRDPNRKFKSLPAAGISQGLLFEMFVDFTALVTHSLPVKF